MPLKRMVGLCDLMDQRPAATTVLGIHLCDVHVQLLRDIAADAGVTVDEELLTGSVRPLERRRLTRAERELAERQEAREIAAARAKVAR